MERKSRRVETRTKAKSTVPMKERNVDTTRNRRALERKVQANLDRMFKRGSRKGGVQSAKGSVKKKGY